MDAPEVLDLAERQHALVATEQLLELGLTSQAVWRMRWSGDWMAFSSHVLARRGAKPTFEQRLMAGVLDAGRGAFLSVESSAAFWKLSGFGLLRLRDIEVSRPRSKTRRQGELTRIHEVRDLQPDHTTVLDGIPISTPTRTIFELAGAVHPKRAERACDSAWARNLTSRALLDRMLDDWADHGRNGTVVMREILESRSFGYVPPASNLESRFNWLAGQHGIGPFRRQVNLGGEEWIGRVDFLDERCPLVVEVLSEKYHSALCDEASDERRFAMLDEVGFKVASVWDHELWGNPMPAIERIRAEEQQMLRRLGRVA